MNKMKEVDEDHKMWGKTIMNHDITRFASNPGSPADSPKDADDVNVSGVNIALKHLDSRIFFLCWAHCWAFIVNWFVLN